MKKSSKVLSSVLACAMLAAVAATAVSAAEQSTTVGYRAGTPATTDADAGTYLYEVDKASEWTAITAENANTAVAVGERNSTTASIDGRVSLIKEPVGAIKGETYKDTLTYVITERQNPDNSHKEK